MAKFKMSNDPHASDLNHILGLAGVPTINEEVDEDYDPSNPFQTEPVNDKSTVVYQAMSDFTDNNGELAIRTEREIFEFGKRVIQRYTKGK